MLDNERRPAEFSLTSLTVQEACSVVGCTAVYPAPTRRMPTRIAATVPNVTRRRSHQGTRRETRSLARSADGTGAPSSSTPATRKVLSRDQFVNYVATQD